MKIRSATTGRHAHGRLSCGVLVLTALGSVMSAAAGCSSSEGEKSGETTSELGGLRDPRTAQAGPPIPAEIDIRPTNGALFDRRVSDLAVPFSGFSDKPGQTIEVQVLSSANAAIAEANWVTIASTKTATTPTTFNDPAPIFRYAVTATPAPSDARGRWIPGGLLRFRVVAVDGQTKTLLPFFDHSSNKCVAQLGAKSWKEVVAKCKSPFSPDLGAPTGGQVRAAALVSSTPEPANRFFPRYLSRKGEIAEVETQAYYDFINAPPTLTDFAARFGFFDRGRNEANAVYYNLGDLGVGREMHCTQFAFRGGNGTACYVRNYGVFADNRPNFSGDPNSALRDALDRVNSFATVAMVKFGDKYSGGPNDVQFFVYNAQDQLANLAQLDSFGSNESIPNNCLNCHGGKYDRRTGALTDSSFLPFDPEAFLFAPVRGFTYEDQEDRIRQLNVMIKNAGSPPGTVQFVDGIYGGNAEQPGAKANLDWIPPGWSKDEESKTVYRELYKPYCRTCHVSQVGDFSFMRIEDFKNENAKSAESVCNKFEMPIAEATLGLFWRSPARAYFVNALGLSTSCAP